MKNVWMFVIGLMFAASAVAMAPMGEDLELFQGTDKQVYTMLKRGERLSCCVEGKDYALPVGYKALLIEMIFGGESSDAFCRDLRGFELKKCYREKGGGRHKVFADLEKGKLVIARKWELPEKYKTKLLDGMRGAILP